MTSDAKSIYENQLLAYQMHGCGKPMANIKHDIFRVLNSYNTDLFYNTPLIYVQHILLNMYTKSRKWSPNDCCEREEHQSILKSFESIHCLYSEYNLWAICNIADYGEICSEYKLCFYQVTQLRCLGILSYIRHLFIVTLYISKYFLWGAECI